MKKPKIRFKGYQEDDWEQRKLGELGSLKNGMNFSKEAMGIGFPFVNLQNIFGNNVIDVTNLGKAMASDSQLKDYNLLNGDVLFVRSSVKLEGVGEAALVPQNLENTTYSGFIIRFRDEYGLDNNFKRFLFGIESVRNQIMAQATNSANKNISQTVLENLCLKIPNKSEQEKIGLYFSNLDHLITLHQRKCEETKTLKKYMLQKMFPQNGHSVPEIRFSGFTEDWEQRKLVDLVDRVTRKNQDLVSELPLTISAQYGLIDQNEFFDKRVASKDVSGYYLIENGEFAYNKSTSTDAPWGAIKRLDRYKNGVLSTLYIVFGIKENNPVDSDFLVSYYSTNLWHKGIHEIAAEGARNHGLLNIAPADFFETKLMIPQDIEEQKKIGKYFEELERLITLHHRKYMKYADLSVFDWEQRKFADFTWDAGKRNKEDLDLEPYAITNEHGFIRQRDAHDDFGYMKDTDRKAYNIVQPNSFAYNPARINVGSIGYYKGVENVIVSSLYEVFQTDNYVNDRFLWHWLKSDEFPRWIEKLQEGSVRLYFYYDKLCECQLYMPSLEEQEKIATFLDDLDHLITLHQHKCEELQNIKKFMLKNMFI